MLTTSRQATDIILEDSDCLEPDDTEISHPRQFFNTQNIKYADFVVFQSQGSHPMRKKKQKNYLHPSLVFATIKSKSKEHPSQARKVETKNDRRPFCVGQPP